MVYVKANDRRAQVTVAARNILIRSGIAALTMRTVAAEAGISLGTLHYVFPSKELLFKSIIEDVGEEISETLHTAFNEGVATDTWLTDGIRNFWAALVTGNPGLQLMQYELSLYAMRNPDLHYLAEVQYEKYCTVVATWCRDASQQAREFESEPDSESRFTDFDGLARMIVAGVDGLILQYLSSRDEARAEEDLENLCVFLNSFIRENRSLT